MLQIEEVKKKCFIFSIDQRKNGINGKIYKKFNIT